MAMACKIMSVLIAALIAVCLHSMLCYANEEVDALIDFKNMLNDPNGVLESWDATLVDPCTWIHITCDGNDKVTRVDLTLSGLSGSLSPRIGDLSSLQYLPLDRNSLTGSIPPSLGKLKNLIALRLSENQFTGQIPSSLVQLSTIQFFDLSNNILSGPVPARLSKFGYESFKGNPGLCGDVVNKPC